MAQRLAIARAALAATSRQLTAIGPQSVLRRGFSYTLLEDGRLLRSPSEAQAGDRLRTVLAEGEVRSTVDGPRPGGTGVPPVPAPDAPPTSKPNRPRLPARNQMDLFNPGR
jgi:hypothetical protein